MFRFPRVIVVLTVGFVFVAACGGSSSPKPAANAGNNTQTDNGSSSSSSSSDSSSNAGGGGGGVPSDIADAAYNSGTGHVDISGGKNASVDFTIANGLTTQGHTFVAFNDAANTSSLTLTVSKTAEESAVVVNVNGLATGGGFGDKCSIDLTKHDASELAGSFTCTGVDGIAGADAFTGNLNVKGTFSAKP